MWASLATSTKPMISTVSAISYFHKLNGLPDPAKNCIIAKLLTGAQNLGTVFDVKLPETMPILICALPHVVTLHYEMRYATGYDGSRLQGLLKSRGDGPLIQQGGVRLPAFQRRGTEWGPVISFRHFKHCGKQGYQSLQVDGQCDLNSAS